MSAIWRDAALNAAESATQRAVDAIALLREGQATQRIDRRWLALCRQASPAATVRDLMAERRRGAALEITQELARKRPIETGNGHRIAWESLYFATRADVVGTLSSGGYMVPTLNLDDLAAGQALMALLLLGKLGVTYVDSQANLSLPKITTPSSTYWLSSETAQVTESDLGTGQLNLTPHMVGGYTEMSRLLVMQSTPSAQSVVANDLVRKIRRAIESAVFNGAGISGQAKGLASASGVNSVSGASFSLATAMSAVTDTGDALADDTAPGWAVAKGAASTLRQRAELSGSSFTLFRGPLTWGTLADFPAGASSGVPSATALFGCWSYLVLCDFGGGIEVSVNPYDASNFKSGIVGMRCFATIDSGPIWPAAFTTVTSIT